MFQVDGLFIKTFATIFAGKSVLPCMLGLVIAHSMFRFKHLATKITCITTALMGPNMQVKIVFAAVSFLADTANIRKLPSMVLDMPLKSGFTCKCFVAFVALQDLHLCAIEAFLCGYMSRTYFLLKYKRWRDIMRKIMR